MQQQPMQGKKKIMEAANLLWAFNAWSMEKYWENSRKVNVQFAISLVLPFKSNEFRFMPVYLKSYLSLSLTQNPIQHGMHLR